ncbi:uncharacterized protein LY89DRAFT_681395 [Mollisia scopiformis]|uniref:T6SS Phospholipase effector Tle1-like catalytic domain-containing protein n=1 Tax=Mollisia scopiformis TaxID=149040 RepID=A0A194XQQ7_MOLSC|nr:uncharacterized protein LY89DRAFT_681395 [Mollisia scopiformis]KUJ22057.1 hypothetical protein LY89DRAFT_681395 [Mollisia scopiformis]
MSSNVKPERPVGKKLVIACDGTWQNSDAGFEQSLGQPATAQIPTNVTRIVRALNHEDENGVSQIAYYQRGVGSDGDLEDKLIGGMTGNDISEHIREAYAFVANNYDPWRPEDLEAALKDETKPMDEIVILGFSRGAYTARAISSIITDMGLLTRKGMEQFWGIFTDWMNQDVDGKESGWFMANYPKIASDFKAANGRSIIFTDPEYRNALIQNKLTRWGMPIRAVGVWDTVGSLGIPKPLNSKNVRPYAFVNTKVAQHIQYAFHAIAIDERRNLFSPTVWEKPDDIAPGQPAMLKKLKQCWFPGSHSNIGGGYPDASASVLSLAWMVSQLEDNGKILSFDPKYLDYVQDLANQLYIANKQPVRPWGFGTLYDSSIIKDPESLIEGIDPINRTPGRYQETDIRTGKPNGTPLKDTHECIHRCVRQRMEGDGPGIQAWTTNSPVDKLLLLGKQALGLHPDMLAETKSYTPKALGNYTLVDDKTKGTGGIYYKAHDTGKNLLEDELGATEIRLLERQIARLTKA